MQLQISNVVELVVMTHQWRLLFLWFCGLWLSDANAAGKLEQWEIGGLKREAWVCIPSKPTRGPAPLVFVFHGHGGTAQMMARQFKMDELWPEALVVYPQGVKTPGVLTDPEGKRSGWQSKAGDHGDRDLLFFDRMLKDLSERHQVDAKRVYATGHSNGGAFSYLLWAERGDRLDAIGPSAASSRHIIGSKPLPVIKVSGTNDRLVKYEWQKATLALVKRINGAQGDGEKWGEGAVVYRSDRGADVVAVTHDKGHRMDQTSVPLIVRFFKKQVKD